MCLNISKLILRLFLFVLLLHINSFGQNNDKWIKWGSQTEYYEVGGNPTTNHGSENNGYIKSIVPEPKGFGTLMANVKPDKYIGKRLKLSAFVKTEEIKDWAGLWMRVDGESDTTLAFDNMENRPIKGTNDWKNYYVVLNVTESALNIAYGILLVGNGKAWIGDLNLEVVSDEIEITEVPGKWNLYRQGKYEEAAKLFKNYAVAKDIYDNKGELIYYDTYDNIFYYLSLYRSGEVEKASEYIQEVSDTLKEDKWINPVVHFYAGKIDENALLKAAEINDEKEENGRKCEAYFYIGMNYLLEQKIIEAKNYFEKCIATNVKDYVEYEMAETELKRISNK